MSSIVQNCPSDEQRASDELWRLPSHQHGSDPHRPADDIILRPTLGSYDRRVNFGGLHNNVCALLNCSAAAAQVQTDHKPLLQRCSRLFLNTLLVVMARNAHSSVRFMIDMTQKEQTWNLPSCNSRSATLSCRNELKTIRGHDQSPSQQLSWPFNVYERVLTNWSYGESVKYCVFCWRPLPWRLTHTWK